MPADPPDDRADAYLRRLTAAMGSTGEDRPGQHEMARAAARAIAEERHLVVQAGTGTGKSLAYLAPVLALGRTAVVATATKALQDQLAAKELPFVSSHGDRPVSWALLKGRSNYLCLQRLDELENDDGQLGLEGVSADLGAKRIKELRVWAAASNTGDRADLDREPSAAEWSAVSVGPRECPGAAKCPRGEDCFAERARRKAATADVIVVNTHLYGLHLATGRMILPDHDVVVFDEAHEVADIISATTGIELTGGRFSAAARTTAGLIADDALVAGLYDVGDQLDDALAEHLGRRLRQGLPTELATVLATGRQRLMDATAAVRKVDAGSNAELHTRVARVMTAVTALVADIDLIGAPPAGTVVWVDGDRRRPRLATAPLDVGATLGELLWNAEATGLEVVTAAPGGDDRPQSGDGPPDVPTTVILTSATIPPSLVDDLGIPADTVDVIDVGSPFDFAHQALLYCAAHLPDPRTDAYPDALADELESLIRIAGGRTLALFTSYRAMDAAADAVASRVPYRVLRQGELPKPALVEAFTNVESSCLFATMGYWQGIDVPGPSLSLVTIDRIPFPRPDEPLLQARREAAGAQAFRLIDVSRAATLLAQGAGRLIRSAEDRGVVAVLDPRLATGKSYRWHLIDALPPMPRTKDIADVRAFFNPTP